MIADDDRVVVLTAASAFNGCGYSQDSECRVVTKVAVVAAVAAADVGLLNTDHR